MLAPEQRDGTQQAPTRESGYFQAAMMMSMILTGRYPTEGMPSEPSAVDQVICQGRWPEHDRPVCPDDLPIEALGFELMALFDRAFSLNPADRPGPDDWRRVLTRALHNCWIHDCGEAFVADATTVACPGCNAAISLPKVSRQLKLQVLPSGPRYGIELVNQKPIVLGRTTMPGLPPTVGAQDAPLMSRVLGKVDVPSLVNLPNYRMFIKLMIDGVQTKAFSAVTLPSHQLPSLRPEDRSRPHRQP